MHHFSFYQHICERFHTCTTNSNVTSILSDQLSVANVSQFKLHKIQIYLLSLCISQQLQGATLRRLTLSETVIFVFWA